MGLTGRNHRQRWFRSMRGPRVRSLCPLKRVSPRALETGRANVAKRQAWAGLPPSRIVVLRCHPAGLRIGLISNLEYVFRSLDRGLPSPEGARQISPGQRPGYTCEKGLALKGKTSVRCDAVTYRDRQARQLDERSVTIRIRTLSGQIRGALTQAVGLG